MVEFFDKESSEKILHVQQGIATLPNTFAKSVPSSVKRAKRESDCQITTNQHKIKSGNTKKPSKNQKH